jgi:hypothetical protein
VKAAEGVLLTFLMRFYDLGQDEAHKLGQFQPNTLHILRLDKRVGTYEHLVTEFEDSQTNFK